MNINDPIPSKVSCALQAKGYSLHRDDPDEREEDMYSESHSENDYAKKFPPAAAELDHLTST